MSRANSAASGSTTSRQAVVFEEAGYSPLGPVALNIFAPDEGNMHLLEAVATPAQKERWLRPLAAGEIRSCFCMTEPAPGAGSDPSMLPTTAPRDGDDYVINGAQVVHHRRRRRRVRDHHGRSSTDGRRDDVPRRHEQRRASSIERVIDTLDTCFPAATPSCASTICACPASDVLGEVGEGFRYAQVRLAPARLTHCMRWLGAARRAHDIAADYARTPPGVRQALGEHEGVGFMLADNEMDLHAAGWRSGTAPGCSTRASSAARIEHAPR